MYNPFKEIHNLLGMVILFILLIVLIVHLVTFLRKKSFGKLSKITSLAGLVLVHTQIIFGVVLYFLSPLGLENFSGEAMGHKISRFYIVEHPIGMLLAAILITIGYRRSKNTSLPDNKRHLQILIFYTLGFVLITYLIPWFLWN